MFYRLHANDDAPCFCAEHAWSGLWGRQWNEDGSATWCDQCDGSGFNVEENEECRNCNGTGWEPAVRGYSCCRDAEELIEYFNEHGVPLDDDTVIVFEGQHVGTGFDGEPLAIPQTVSRTLTWAQLIAGRDEAQ